MRLKPFYLPAALSLLLCAGCVSTSLTPEDQREMQRGVAETVSLVRQIRSDQANLQERLLGETGGDLQSTLEQILSEVRSLSGRVEQLEYDLADLNRNFRTLRAGGVSPPTEVSVTPPSRTASTTPVVSEPPPATSGNPDDDYTAARIDYNIKKYEQAAREFEAVFQNYPDHHTADNALFWEADCYAKLGQSDKALETYHRLYDNFPLSDKVPDGLFNEGVLLLSLGRRDEGEEKFRQVIQDHPLSAAREKAEKRLGN